MEQYIQSNKVPRCAHTKSLTLIESPAWFCHQFTSKSIKLGPDKSLQGFGLVTSIIFEHQCHIYLTFWSLAYPVVFGGGAKGTVATGYVYQQPQGGQQDLAVQAMISCPTGSIRTWTPLRKTREWRGGDRWRCPNKWQRISRNMFEVRVDIRVDEDMVLESMVLCF